jgi:hypothetical protein
LFDFSASDVRYIIVSFAVIIASGIITNGLLSITLLAPLLLIGGLWRHHFGRVHKYIREETAGWWMLYGPRRGYLHDDDRQGRFRRRMPPVFEFSVGRIVTQMMSLGVIHAPAKAVDYAVAVGDGSPFGASDIPEMHGMVGALARTAAHINAEVRESVGFSYVVQYRSPNPFPRHTYLASNMKPEIAQIVMAGGKAINGGPRTPQERVNQRQAENFLDVLAMQQANEQHVTRAVVVGVKRTKVSLERLSDRQVYRAAVGRISRMLEADLGALGVQGAKTCGICKLSEYIRTYMDGAHIQQYRQAVATGKIPELDEQLVVDPQTGEITSNLGHWLPGVVRAGPDYLYIGDKGGDTEKGQREGKKGTFHRVLMVIGLPEDATPELFDQLLRPHGGLSRVTVLGEVSSGEKESRRMTKGISMRRSFRSWQRLNYESPPEEAARKEQEQGHKQLYEGGNVLSLFNVLAIVSGTTLEDVQEVQEAFETTIRRLGMKRKVIRGAARQLRAFVSGLGFSQL